MLSPVFLNTGLIFIRRQEICYLFSGNKQGYRIVNSLLTQATIVFLSAGAIVAGVVFAGNAGSKKEPAMTAPLEQAVQAPPGQPVPFPPLPPAPPDPIQVPAPEHLNPVFVAPVSIPAPMPAAEQAASLQQFIPSAAPGSGGGSGIAADGAVAGGGAAGGGRETVKNGGIGGGSEGMTALPAPPAATPSPENSQETSTLLEE